MRDDAFLSQRDHDPVQAAGVVLGPRVERERPADSDLAFRFVDVTVQCEERLELLDQLSHRVAADRLHHRLPAAVPGRQVRLQIGPGVEPAVVGRNVQVEDRAARVDELVGELLEPLEERFLVELPRAVPRRRIGEGRGDHLVRPDAHDLVVAEHDSLRAGEDVVDEPGIVVAGHHVQL